MEYRYTLKPYRKPSDRRICPSCGRRGEFSPYIDKATGEALNHNVGRCNREQSCGYHLKPKDYFKSIGYPLPDGYDPKPEKIRPVDFLPLELLEQSAHFYKSSNFYKFFTSAFTSIVADKVFQLYCVGSSRYWQGAVLFPQIDLDGNFRQAKIMQYDAATGRRIKAGAIVEKFNPVTNQFESIKADQDCAKVYGRYLTKDTKGMNLEQVPFGFHLLTEMPDNIICLVESEKTAMIAAACLPSYCWIASGGSNGAKWKDYSITKNFDGRDVILFPDLGQFDNWKAAADHINSVVKCNIKVSPYLENSATDNERADGYDLADYLLRSKDKSTGLVLTDDGYPASFDFNPKW